MTTRVQEEIKREMERRRNNPYVPESVESLLKEQNRLLDRIAMALEAIARRE